MMSGAFSVTPRSRASGRRSASSVSRLNVRSRTMTKKPSAVPSADFRTSALTSTGSAAPCPRVERVLGRTDALAARKRRETRTRRVTICRSEQVDEIAADDLVFGAPIEPRAARRRRVGDPAGEVGRADEVRRRGEHAAEPVLAGGERACHPVALGQVGRDAGDPHRPAAGIAQDHRASQQRNVVAVAVAQPVLDLERFPPRGERGLEVRIDASARSPAARSARRPPRAGRGGSDSRRWPGRTRSSRRAAARWK